MSGMDELVEWLREVWDADEQAARGASPGPWAASGHSLITVEGIEIADVPRRDASHIARHDPVDTLARIEAERRIVDLCITETPATGGHPLALRALAFGYRHRPGWQEGWAP